MTASAISTRQSHRKIGCRDRLIVNIGIGTKSPFKEKTMKYLLVLMLTGCAAGSSWNASLLDGGSSSPEQKMTLDKNIQAMSRNEVILAVQECESSGLRAVMIIAKRKINNYTTDVVADVSCAPKYRY
jgi:hypothetical protein